MTPRRRTATVIGAARNCGRHLPRVLENLERLAGAYGKTQFFFAVGDSTDGTAALLESWLDGGRAGRLLMLGDLERGLAMRTERIAAARNACLDEAARSPAAGLGHLVVADMDDVMTAPLDIDAFRQAAAWLDASPERAGAFANAAPRYYDIWALRHDTWCPGDCWHPIWGRSADEPFAAAKIREVFTRQIVLPPSLPPIPVRSAFGGLALYKATYALQARYRGVDPEGRPVSEHVAFNRAIGAAGGRLHILPSLMVRAPREHLYDPLEFTPRWRLAMLGRRLAEQCVPPWRRLLRERSAT